MEDCACRDLNLPVKQNSEIDVTVCSVCRSKLSDMNGGHFHDGRSEECFFFDNLPIELQYKVMSYLNPPELCQHVAPVCKGWKHIAYDPVLWKHLHFNGNQKSVNTVQNVLERCQFLQSLSLYNFSNPWELASTLISCGRLQKLTLCLCNGISATFIALLNKCSPLIQEANFEGSDLDDRSAVEIANWKNLHTLNLFNCTCLSDESIIFLAKACAKLKNINIDGIFNITDKAIETLSEERKSTLQKLYVDGEQLTDRSYHAIGQCKDLVAFSVSFADGMTDKALLSIRELNKLNHLKIARGLELSNAEIGCFFNRKMLSDLTYLNIGHCNNLEDGGIQAVAASCTKLKTLELDWCWSISDVGIEAIATMCKDLQHLSLIGLVLITDVCLESYLKRLPYLVFLDIQQCSNVEDASILDLIETNHDVIVHNYYGEKYSFADLKCI